MLLPAVTCKRIIDSELSLRSTNTNRNNKITDVNGKLINNNQFLEKSNNRRGQKTSSSSSLTSEHADNKNRLLKSQTKNLDTVRKKYAPLNPNLSTNNQQQVVKKNYKSNENLNAIDHHQTGIGKANNSLRQNHNQGNIRSINNQIDNNCSKDFTAVRSKDHSGKNYSTTAAISHSDYNKITNSTTHHHNQHHHQEFKSRNINNNNSNNNNSNFSQFRFANEQSNAVIQQKQRDSSSNNINKISLRNDTIGLTTTTAHKALEQHNLVPKMGQMNFPPLRAPQSIVNVRHPFVTEARIKQNEYGGSNIGQKTTGVKNSIQNNQINDIEHNNRQTFHGYGSSPIANIQNVQTLGNITSLAQYPRPDSFPQQTLASVLFPETSQFPQSPPYATPQQVGQINQFQAYDPGSFTPTPVNVNSVIPQFSTETSQLSYPQFENPQFVQTNHYSTADIANGQFQYQATGVPQISETPLYLQSLQSPLTVPDQYATPNYAQAVRAELIPRMRRPPRFNK